MRKIKMVCLLLFCFLITGCWNYNELNDLAITTGIAIDVRGDNYVVSYMIANAKKSEGESKSQEASSVVYSGEGPSISAAYMDLNGKISKIPYISHLEVLVISEDAAKKGVMNIIDFLMRNPESRKEFYVLLSKATSAKSILEILTPLESFPSQSIANNLLSNKTIESTVVVEEFSDFISKLIGEGINPILSGAIIEGDEEEGKDQSSLESSTPSAVININSTGIFKDDKLLGWAGHNESIGINILTDEAESILLESKCEDQYMAATLTNIQTNTDFKFENDIPKITISVAAEGALVEINCKKNLEETSTIKELSTAFAESLKNMLYRSINLAQSEYKSDIFGYGNMIYKTNLEKWRSIKDSWEADIFPNLDFEINTQISLSSKGSFEQTVLEAKNEE